MDILLLGIFWNDQAIITDKSFAVLATTNLQIFNECGEHTNYYTRLDIPLSSEYKTKASCVWEETWGAWATTTATSSRTKTLYLHHAFLYISLQSLHDYEVKMPKFTICRGREHKTTTFLFFSWTSIQSFRIQLEKKIAKIWRINWDGLSAIKFEAAQIHFLSDVL